MAAVINGRFLRATPVGLHRAARSMLDALLAAGLDAEVLAPPGVQDARVDRRPWAPQGRLGDHLWEQFRLPLAAGSRTIVSLANTAPLAARRSVVVVHDLAPLIGPQWFAPSVRAYGRLVLLGARRAALVVTVSQAAASDLAEHGVRADRIAVVRPAVDPLFAPAAPERVTELRARLNLTRPYAVVVGWADPRKDSATAVAAHLAVEGAVPHDLVLAGRPHVTFAPVHLPVAPSVRLAGYLPDGDLRTLLSGASALLYPSLYEGFGLPPLEAWACGTPALVSDIPALRESTGGRGILLPPGDVAVWADALRHALAGGLPVPQPPTRTWADAGMEMLAALDSR